MLVDYTPKKLQIRMSYERPLISIRSNGIIFFYNSLIKKLNIKPGDDQVLFSFDPDSGKWYLSKSKQGLKVKFHIDAPRNGAYITSISLRNRIIMNSLHLLNSVEPNDCLYMSVSDNPISYKSRSELLYEIKLLR